MNGPIPLVVGDCTVTRILTKSRVVNVIIKVPVDLTDESNTDIIFAHLQRNIVNLFNYLIAEGFVKDRNYFINQILIQQH